jgi:hypothetical protein
MPLQPPTTVSISSSSRWPRHLRFVARDTPRPSLSLPCPPLPKRESRGPHLDETTTRVTSRGKRKVLDGPRNLERCRMEGSAPSSARGGDASTGANGEPSGSGEGRPSAASSPDRRYREWGHQMGEEAGAQSAYLTLGFFFFLSLASASPASPTSLRFFDFFSAFASFPPV